MKKITKREMYKNLIAYFNGDETVNLDKEAVIKFAENEIKLLDNKREAAKKAAEQKRAEGDVLTDAIAEVLTDEFTPIADITAVVADGNEDITAAKVTYRLNQLVENGKAEKQLITIKGNDGQKTRKIQGYRAV